jgi:AFG3 family protein
MWSRSADHDGLHSPPGASQAGPQSQYRYYFNIGSIDSFERKMEEAQEDMNWPPSSWVPITYTNELSWQQELLRLAPTILLIAGYVWFTRRQLGSLGGQGPGGRGIFNVGKAQVSTLAHGNPVSRRGHEAYLGFF